MFEESEWGAEATSPIVPSPALLSLSRPGPSAGNSREQRRRLRAILRTLEDLAPRTASSASSPGRDRGQKSSEGSVTERQQGSRAKRRRRRRRPETPPTEARTVDQDEGEATAAPLSEAPVESHRGILGAAERRADGPLLTRKQWRNRQKNRRRPKNKFKGVGAASGVGPSLEEPTPAETDSSAAPSPAFPGVGARVASLRLRLEQRLDSARFRYINQQLYTCSSQEAARLSREDPEALAAYHRGFARQVARWPEKPVERFVRYLRNRPASLVVADIGCGDCTLARSLRNQVHCFDLVALDPRVIVCDMAQVPLEAESVDVAVFCLALLGTNLREILEEAHRVLCLGGTLLVAEVASRFVEVGAFVGALAQLGFRLLSKDVSDSHFYAFEFRKTAPSPSSGSPGKLLPGLALRPCLYKRR